MLDYAHLHLHTEYSLLDGANKIIDLPKLAKEYGMSSMAITDHGSLAGCLEFYREAIKVGIKPVLGIESYISNDEDGWPNEKKTRDNYHMILLAASEEGWENLLYLNSNAYKNNFYYKPRISVQQLAAHSKGLIGNSACLAGVCSRSATYDEINHVYSDPEHKAEKTIHMFREIFHGNFYLEMMESTQEQQIAYNKFLIHMSAKTGQKLIISADAHYTKKEDEGLHEMLMAMQSKRSIEEYRADGYFRYENCYIRPPEEMLAAAKLVGSEAAFHNTLEVASLCNLHIELGKYKLPIFDMKADPDYAEYSQG